MLAGDGFGDEIKNSFEFGVEVWPDKVSNEILQQGSVELELLFLLFDLLRFISDQSYPFMS